MTNVECRIELRNPESEYGNPKQNWRSEVFQTKKGILNFELESFVLVSNFDIRDFELSLSLGATQPAGASAPIANGNGDRGKWSNIGPVA